MHHPFSGDFLQWIHTFLSVLETHSIQRSAQRLCLSPSAVSYQIRKLETELGRTLFERTSSGMTATHEGLQLRNDILPILDALDRLKLGKNAGNRLKGTIHITCLDRLAHELVFHILNFRRLHPEVHFILDATSSKNVHQLVVSGMMDFGLTIYREIPGFIQFTEFRPSSAFLYTPKGNPYDLPPVPTWQQICTLPFIALTLDGYVNPILATIPDLPQPKNVIIAINNFILAMQLVREGVGVCIAPPLTPLETEEDYTIFNIDHIFAIGRLGIISRKNKLRSSPAREFFDYLRVVYPRGQENDVHTDLSSRSLCAG